MKKNMIRIACFIFSLGFLLGYINKIFEFKYSDGICQMSTLYELDKNTVDVLILGSSHAFVNFNNGTLWDEYGMASYNLGASMQPMWNSYFYLKEALKTQKPELIVLEGYGASFDFEYSDDSRIIKNTYGMKWTNNRIDAIKTSAPKERWRDFLLDYTQYHNRYKTIGQSDFMESKEIEDTIGGFSHYNNWKGQLLFDTFIPIDIRDVSNIKEKIDLEDKTELYYRKIIELAQSNNIPITVIVAPYQISEYEQKKYNKAAEIAKEYNVKFLNTNIAIENTGLDLSCDYRDNCHMTANGSRKFSLYIGEFLKSNYDISDRREDKRYNSWNDTAEYTRQYIYNEYLKNSNDVNEIVKLLKNNNYLVFMSVAGEGSTDNKMIRSFLQTQGISKDNGEQYWVMKNGKLIESGIEETDKYIRTRTHDFKIQGTTNSNGNYNNNLIVDNEMYQKVSNGLNVVIFDIKADNVIDSFGIDLDNANNIVR